MGASTQARHLTWEWADGRKPERFLVVRVHKVAKDRGGPLGVGKSPSMAAALPDATNLEGSLIHGADGRSDATVALTLPGVEASSVSTGDRVALGIVSGDVCICVARAPRDLPDTGLAAWVGTIVCKP